MAQLTSEIIASRSRGWIADLERAIRDRDEVRFNELFVTDSHWRDLLALTWDLRQFSGLDRLRENFLDFCAVSGARDFRVDPNRSAPRAMSLNGTQVVEFFFAFDTDVALASAFVRLLPDENARWGMRARVIGTTLIDLRDAPLPAETHKGYEPETPGETWLQHRSRRASRDRTDPDVLIVGGGQAGLAIAARLDRRGASYLIVNNLERPGDSWRNRYASLALHTPTCVNNLPYLKLPEGFPRYMSKDQWAGWLDSYATALNLNYASSTEFLGGEFDEGTRTWTARLRKADGSVQTLQPKHLVLAIGWTGTEPIFPVLPEADNFAGEILHSSEFVSGAAYAGRNVLVVGASTSAHDIALDLYNNGANTYMLQRGAACIIPIDEADRYNVDYLDPTRAEDEVDQRRNSGFIYPLLYETAVAETARTEEQYAEMFDGLRKAGMALTVGGDCTGWLMRLHRTFSGYYLDVGCSQVIVDRGIKVLHTVQVDKFVEAGLQLADGSVIELDAVVTATGYHNAQTVVGRLLGDETAEKIGPVGGLGQDGEHRNMVRPTAQPHLWMIFGGIMDARKTSDLLALEIIAQLRGIAPSLVRGADGLVRPLDGSITESSVDRGTAG